MYPNAQLPGLNIPKVIMKPSPSSVSLADITDLEPFRALGRQLVTEPDESLRRQRVRARITTGASGLRRTEIFTEPAQEPVYSQAVLLPLEDMVAELVDAVFHSEAVPERAVEIEAAKSLVNTVVNAMEQNAHSTLSGYLETIKVRLVRLVNDAMTQYAQPTKFSEVIGEEPFAPQRMTRPGVSQDRFGVFRKGQAYSGWRKSMYEQAWFDSSTERDMANILDGSPDIRFWVRLHRGDLVILRNNRDQWYNPDFVAVDTDGVHWIVEVKQDREMKTPDVQEKREAARRWANRVSLDPQVHATWRYLLASEQVVRDAHETWRIVKALSGE